MNNVREFVYPASVDEAVRMLVDGRGKARIIAGGTSVSQSRDTEAEVLVDITRCGLNRIVTEDSALRIGACVTAADIAVSDQVRSFGADVLQEAAREVGPAGVRNAVTLGGNVVQCYPWSDMPVALLALEVSAVVQGVDPRTWPLAELFSRHPTRQLGPGNLLTHFLVDRPKPGSGTAFVKFRRTAVDFALISSAVFVELDRAEGWGDPSTGVEVTRVRSARVVVGAARSLPSVVVGLEALSGAQFCPDESWRARVAARAQEAVTPSADLRASAEYRTGLIGVVVRRALDRAVGRALGSLAAA